MKAPYKLLVTWLSAATCFLTGCTDLAETNLFDSRVTIAAANQLLESDDFEKIDLVEVLDPKRFAQKQFDDSHGKDAWAKLEEGKRIDLAFAAFYADDAYSKHNIELRRNRVQERILSSSNQRCNVFKAYLHRVRSETNFLLGSLATITGVAGSMVTGVAGSRILSGTSGIFSGVRAEFNQEMFQNVATQVIISGIDLRRREVYEEIALKGQSKKIEDYTVEAAVKDAIFYHGQCNILVGMSVAGDSIKSVEDPGLTAAARAMVKVNILRKIQDEHIADLNTVQVIKGADGQLVLAGTPLDSRKEHPLPTQALVDARGEIKETEKSIRGFIAGLTELPDELKNGFIGKDMALDNATKAALSILATCDDEAKSRTDAVVAANRALDESTTEDDKLDKMSLRDAAVLRARALVEVINKVPALFAHYTSAAREVLQKAHTREEFAGAGKEAHASLKKVEGIKACAAVKD